MEGPILIIEDDEGLALLIKEAVEGMGLRAAVCPDGASAEEWLRGAAAALAILDYTLPDATAAEFLRRVAMPPFIVTTGRGDESIAVDMMKKGARDYLVKDALFLEALPTVVARTLRELETEGRLAAARRELAASERKFKRLFTDSTLGKALIPAGGGPLERNPAFDLMFGSVGGERELADFLLELVPPGEWRTRRSEFSLAPGGRPRPLAPGAAAELPADAACFDLSLSRLDDGDGEARLFFSFADVTERMRFEARMAGALREKELLLKEVHHRVKNNLQIISSLLNLELSMGAAGKTVEEVFREVQGRIMAMALVHESLYRSEDLATIDFAQYLERIAEGIQETLDPEGAGPRVGLKLERAWLGIDCAVPLGLLANEMITNAVKHAFPPGWAGERRIELGLSRAGGTLALWVADNGVGIPEELRAGRKGSLGLQLLKLLVEQLGGEIALSGPPGTRWEIGLPVSGCKPSPGSSSS